MSCSNLRIWDNAAFDDSFGLGPGPAHLPLQPISLNLVDAGDDDHPLKENHGPTQPPPSNNKKPNYNNNSIDAEIADIEAEIARLSKKLEALKLKMKAQQQLASAAATTAKRGRIVPAKFLNLQTPSPASKKAQDSGSSRRRGLSLGPAEINYQHATATPVSKAQNPSFQKKLEGIQEEEKKLGRRRGMSLGPSELVCFRFDENSSTIEESISEQGVGSRGIQNSTNRVTLADVTSVYAKYLERGSLSSANTMPQMEIDHKENDNLSVRRSSVQSSNAFRSQLNKTYISGKANGRRGRTVSGRRCKPGNINSNVPSFIPLIREKQQIAASARKRDIKVKALEVAEAAKRLEEKRQYEREMRKAAAKLERVRLEQENVQRLELKQKQKEESRKKREADLEAIKRQREVERIEKERKKRCTEEARKHQRANLQRSCIEKGDKELRDKKAKENKRKGTELPKDAKKQAQLVKEREVAANRKTLELVPSFSKVVSADSGHVNSGMEAHAVFLKENDFSKDHMSLATETQSYEDFPYKDGDEDRVRMMKYVPAWARGDSLIQIVLSTRHLDPMEIFSRKRSFDLNKFFPQVPRRPPRPPRPPRHPHRHMT